MISASNILITGGTFIQNVVPASNGFELLTQKVATRARYDSGKTSDPEKCHPDTRVAILGDLEEWAEGLTYNYPIRWVNGSAGVGKTAIMRTTAESLETRKLLLACFFFRRTDGTCNSGEFFIATLAYQIAISIPATRTYIERAVEENPHIFTQTLEAQSRALILDPITTVYRQQALPSNYPRVFVIDGLDECLDAKLESQDVEKQCEILRTLHYILKQLPTPFALLIASRQEYHIQSMFDTTLKDLSSSLFLNDSADVDADIRRFYSDKFREVQEHHPLRSYLPPSPQWPSSDTIGLLVWRASGQFIYASTVIKFVSARKKNPCVQLDAILGKEVDRKTSPFQKLDALYRTIFSAIDEEDLLPTLRVLGALLLGRTARLHRTFRPSFWDQFLGLQQGEVHRLMLGLESLLSVNGPTGNSLHFFHASLQDFLFDQERSGVLFIDRRAIYEILAKQSIRHLSTTDDVMGRFITTEMGHWFGEAYPSIELHNAIEKAHFSMGPRDLKSRYPGFLRAIKESKLPAKRSLYDIHLSLFHTQLSQFISLYCREESLVFVILAFLSDCFNSRQLCIDFVNEHSPLSPELEHIEREQGFDLCGDTSYNERNMQIIRPALEEVIANMAEVGKLYAQAASLLLKSYCQQYRSDIDTGRESFNVLCKWLNKASAHPGLTECIKNNPIYIRHTGDVMVNRAIHDYLSVCAVLCIPFPIYM